MKFQQKQLTRSTQLVLRENGLFVSQRDGRGRIDIAVEIPYEELLPIEVEYRNTTPQIQWRWAIVGIFWLLKLLHVNLGASLSNEEWSWVFGGMAALGGFVFYAHRNWWHQAIVHTAHLKVVLADHPADRGQLRAFVEHLEKHTKTYLRREYAPINPLGLIEPQLRRLAWLHELAVLDMPEAQALVTRLTGRLPGRGFKSMGQKLEPPYVN
ncbi:hypothetical protein [Hymenobacter baengnokdamensis]|uniref:hypothetical protein n=1 Tax=Hymenobacter baengnokdamensis TaxID=2615203 RepID=UPI0012466F82|nr:hypothetical protein [Hymenobacter baengnokdamensis]